MEELLNIKGINKRFNKDIIFKNFDISFYKHKVNCILGKSGCGKTTLLNILSGIITNDTHYINEIKDLKISYIFQEDRLIDWLSVEENIILTCKNEYNEMDLKKNCHKYLKLVGLNEYKKAILKS